MIPNITAENYSLDISLQTDIMPRPFHHIYVEHGYFVTQEFATNPTNFLASAVDHCEDYMELYHGTYLQTAGFKYSDFLEVNPDDIDTLAVLLTAMLNRVHLCIHYAGGMWHTHIKTRPCACSLHLASMGNNTFVALQSL